VEGNSRILAFHDTFDGLACVKAEGIGLFLRAPERRGDMEQVNEQQVIRKARLRLVPFLVLCFIIAYVDRVNVSFAALTMNKDIGLNAYTYGLGAGIFFLGYFIFEVPSNLIMARVGARRWIARILFSWGLVACAMMWVQGPKSFLTMRFILGVAEAGFGPGAIFYLTYWFPARYRARVISQWHLGIPLALAIGAPVSTWIMQLNGALGLKGWQWLFLVEGMPAILLSIVVLFILPDGPSQASWLTDAEKRWLEHELESDREKIAVKKAEAGVRKVLTSPIIWAFGLIYFAAVGSNYGLSMFMPQIIKQQGFSTMQTGWIMSVPYFFGCIGMVAFGYLSDRFKERKWHLIASLMLAGIGLGAAGLLGPTMGAIMMFCVATIGIMGVKGPFWPIPAAYLSGAGAAAGIAFINSVGNLGGWAGPYMVGWFKYITDSFKGGLCGLALLAFAGALVTLITVKVAKVPTAAQAPAAGNAQTAGKP
jgi:ACS family tartrate transporter-like MFS transporter